MPTSSQKLRLGIFIFVGILAFLVLMIIIGSEQIFKDKDIYYISYKDISVSGLEVGSPVKYLGVGVGTIKDIFIDPEDVSRVVVTVALEPGTPIKRDARAEIAIIGITGLKMIEIRGGSQEEVLLDPEGYIRPGGSITEEITGKAEVIADKIEIVVNNLTKFTQPENLEKITLLADKASATFENINLILEENRKDFRTTIKNTNMTMARLDTMSYLLQESIDEIHQITTGDTLKQIVENVREVTEKLRESDIVSLVHRLDELVERVNYLLIAVDHDLERGSKDFIKSIQKLKSALIYLDETSRLINEDPSILIRGTSIEDAPDDDLDR
jgi:phospholipid/cholesterol/gamma-HCH transport system substrate-binding protein